MQKIPENSKFLKNDGHFQIPHPQISFKQFSNFCENVVYFFTMQGGGKMSKDFRKKKFKKKLKMVSLTFCNFHTL